MKRYSIAYALAVVISVGTYSDARAMESVSPSDVSIVTCRPERSWGPDTNSAAAVETGHGVRIVFENRGTVDLSAVTFAVEDEGERVLRQDVGRFSPGARIDHYFAAGDLPENSAPLCSVVAVR